MEQDSRKNIDINGKGLSKTNVKINGAGLKKTNIISKSL